MAVADHEVQFMLLSGQRWHVLCMLMKLGMVALDPFKSCDAPLEEDARNVQADPLVRVRLWWWG